MSTETAHKNRGGLKRHKKMRAARQASGRAVKSPMKKTKVDRCVFCARVRHECALEPCDKQWPHRRVTTRNHRLADENEALLTYQHWVDDRLAMVAANRCAHCGREFNGSHPNQKFCRDRECQSKRMTNTPWTCTDTVPTERDRELRQLVAQQQTEMRYPEKVNFRWIPLSGAVSFSKWADAEGQGEWFMGYIGGVHFDREDDIWSYKAERGRARKTTLIHGQ